MKKAFLSIIMGILSTISAHSQTFDEWFRQNKTQIKYLTQQIAAYELLLDYTTNGYKMAQKDLTFIGAMKNEEFDLHRTYFNSLKLVSTAVLKYSRINDIITGEHAIKSNFKRILQAKNMNAAEINYLNAVYNKMNNECNRSLDELIDILTDNTYTMKDDQRIKRIDRIYYDIKDKYAFSQSFTSEALLLSAQRQSRSDDINESLINNGLQ